MDKQIKQRWFLFAMIIGLCPYGTATVLAADWPTYRGDSSRQSYTAETLPAELALHWVYHSRHAPQPAWSGYCQILGL